MATSKAQNAPANGNANVKTNGNIKVVMPDANGDFTAPISKGAIDKVQVVDVDMVLQLKDGTSMVLAGGAISAMDASHTEVKFNDGLQGLSNLFDLVGTISIPKLDPILSSLQGAPNSDGHGSGTDSPVTSESSGLTASLTTQIVNQLTQIVQVNAQSVTIKTVDPTAQTAVLSQNTKTGDVDAQPLQHVDPPLPPEKPGVVPQEHIVGPDAPAMQLALVNLTTITQIGNVLYGSGGTPASATDSSNNAQFASQVINAPADATEIHAISNIPPNDFIKVVDMQLTGNGIAQTILVKGVPAGISIANGHDMGGGVWSIDVVAGQRDYGIQIEYTTTPADPSAPIHQQFSLEFDVTMTTADGIVELSQVKQFVVKDVHSANDLTYIDSTTGQGVYVLPAQGNSHIIHAGDAGVTIYGSNADDFLFGGAGADTIHGGTGNTYFEGGGGADQLIGGTGGVNTAGYTQSATGVTVDLVAGTGTGGDAQGDTLTNIQNVIGSAHNDTIVSSAAANNINGGGHDAGGDTVSYADSGVGVNVNLSTGKGLGGDAQGDVLTGIQNVIGSTHNDTFIASSDANTFTGGGRDVTGLGDIVSYAEDTSGLGATVDLSTGTRSAGAAQGDVFIGIDGIIGTAFNDTFIDGAGANRYDGGVGGQDTVSYVDSTAGVTVNLSNGRGTGGYAEGDNYVNIQNVIGSSHNDIFIAGVDSKSFTGGGADAGGFDTVSFLASGAAVTIDNSNAAGDIGSDANGATFTFNGIQKFVGSNYDDTFIAGAAANIYDGGSGGSDTVDYSHSNGAVTVDLTSTTGAGTSGGYAAGDQFISIENVIGSQFDDTFVASADANHFDGRGGSNTVSYAASTFGVIVDLSNTTLPGTSGGYALGDSFTNIQNLIGSQFDDTFVASSDANRFDGGTGGTSNGGINTVSYSQATSGVVVDLSNTTGAGTSGGAAGDSFIRIQNLIGSQFDDTFVSSSDANVFDGGSAGSDTVSYAQSNAAVTVDLSNTTGAGTSGGFAAGDRFISIENVIGSSFDDTFYASGDANKFDGGTAGSDTVSYARAADGNGVTVDLFNNTGTGGIAAGDTYVSIENVTGTQYNDTFIDGTGAAANAYVGGGGSDTVSYAHSGASVTVNFVTGQGSGPGSANGDTYNGIQNVIGSSFDDRLVVAAVNGRYDGGVSVVGSHNILDFSGITTTTGATINLVTNTASTSANSYTLANIQDVVGTAQDDVIYASGDANNIDGGTSVVGSHNRVDYSNSNAGVTVDLVLGTGVGGYAQGDTLTNIQDVTGSNSDDTFIANNVANKFDGLAGSDTVSYAKTTGGVGVTVDLFAGTGTGGFAQGDTYANIENVIGSDYNDRFVASAAANSFNGGLGSNTVDYSSANDGNGVIVNLFTSAGANGFAQGDTYLNIQNVIGTQYNDTFVDGSGTAPNSYTGGLGSDTVSYANSTAAVTVNFATGLGSGTGSSFAIGDTYNSIENVIGSSFDDRLVVAAVNGSYDGGVSVVGSHNILDFSGITTTTGATINLVTNTASTSANSYTLANIQDVVGSAQDDVIFANGVANNIDGGTSVVGSHNRVNYSNSAAGVTVDLFNNVGAGGDAAGDTYLHIQDATGSNSDDTFVASNEANKFDGGTGSDTVDYSHSNAAVTIDLKGGTSTGGYANGDVLTNIENIIGSAFNDTFAANGAANSFTGGGGIDTVTYAASGSGVVADLNATVGATGGDAAGDTYHGITNLTGSGSADTLTGLTTGGSTLDGGAGNDTLIASGGNNTLIGGTGNDSMTAGGDNNVFVGGAGNDTMTGTVGNHNNTVDYSASAQGVIVDLFNTNGAGTSGGDAQGDILVGIQNVKGSNNADTFVGNADINVFTGGGGNDTVSYVHSNATVIASLLAGVGGTAGDAANDVYNAITNLTGGSGDDTLTGLLLGGSILTGNDGNDTLIATGGNNTLNGGNGNDIMTAGGNNNLFIGGAGGDTMTGTGGTGNRATYAGSASAVTVDLFYTDGTGTSGSDAAGDKLSGIQNLTGTAGNDTFILNEVANDIVGNGGVDTVSYVHEVAGTDITIDLSGTAANDGATGTGTFGAADTFHNIQNAIGGGGHDIFFAGAAANFFDGGSGTETDTVSYAKETVAGNTTGVTVNFLTNTGSGNWAAGDTYAHIENVVGTGGNDTFIDGGGVVNSYDGGTNGAGSHDLVSYQFVSTGGALTIGLDGVAGHNTGNSATGNVGDTYSHIADLTGSATLDTTIWGDTNANILTAMGTTNTNVLNGGGGNDTLDARLGGHNTVLAGTSGNTIVESTVSLAGDGVTSIVGSNIVSINGSTSNTTLDLHHLSNFLDLSSFRGIVTNITTLDLMDQTDTDKGSGATNGTQAKISSDDIVALGIVVNGHSELTVALDTNTDSLRLDTPSGQYQVITTTATTNDYTYYSVADNHEIAVLHVLK